MQNIFVYFFCNKMLKQKGKYKILKQAFFLRGNAEETRRDKNIQK
jgi:hypothetical protein